MAVKPEPWGDNTITGVQQQVQIDPKKDDTVWKQDPRIQALVVEHVQQLAAEA